MNNVELKAVKGLEEWARKQFTKNHFIYYSRKGAYAECHCAECGEKYVIRTTETGDPFRDSAMRIEKPERDMETVCRGCKTKAIYKPAGHTKDEYQFHRICYGQKIDDDHFVFRIFYTYQKTEQGRDTIYGTTEDKRIFLEKGKKPSRYIYYWQKWHESNIGENWDYIVHPRTYKEIAKTGMIKYVPGPTENWSKAYGLIDYYIAAVRYPDFEMIIKAGLTEYARNLVGKIPVNPNPRGKTIEDRLRINKDRVKSLVDNKGEKKILQIYQLERRLKKHWTEEELGIIEELRNATYFSEWEKVSKILTYVSPVRLKNYMKKQKMWIPGKTSDWRETHSRADLRREYCDYIMMRKNEGYDMTNDVILFPSDFRRRRDEMILLAEKAKMDKRKKEVLEKFPKIKTKYRKLSEKYSAAGGDYIIRPAKDAAEIVEEGRILHHCVGGDGYLSSHNNGRSVILFLRKTDKKDVPLITVEIRDEEIIQWYGAYDKKPNEKLINAWLKKYTKELAKRKGETKAFKEKAKAAKTA